MSKLLAMAIPILPGKEQEWAKWMHELKTVHYREFVASRKRLGVRERVFLQHSPTGDVVIVLLKGDDPAAALSQFGNWSACPQSKARREERCGGSDNDKPCGRSLTVLTRNGTFH